MKYLGLIFSFVAMLSFTGCELNPFADDDSKKSDSSKVSVGDTSYYMPDGVSKAKALEGDRGVVIESGDNQELSGFVATAPESAASPAPAFKGGALKQSSALTSVDTVITELGYMSGVSNVNVLTKQVFSTPTEVAIVDMQIETYSSYTSMEVVQMMLTDILQLEKTYEISDNNAPTATNFRALFAVVYFEGAYYYLAAVLPETAYNQYGGVASLVVSPSNFIQEGTTIVSDTDTFTATAGSNKADFLFVVDDSGSMSDEQSAIAAVASDFKNAVINAGLSDFNIAIISTGDGIDSSTGSANYTLNTTGIINDMTVFENSVVLGTSGSATETGIYNAEYSLGTNGYLANDFGFPRAGTSLSVIILSDESSQYTSRSGGATFDVNNNLFVTNGYIVHAIVDQSYTYGSQYEDLAAATGGLSANIYSGGTTGQDYSQIMSSIAVQAGGASSTFKLTHQNVFVSKIEVKIDGQEILPGTTNGWGFNQSTNTVAFYGTALPQGGETVTITYEYQE